MLLTLVEALTVTDNDDSAQKAASEPGAGDVRLGQVTGFEDGFVTVTCDGVSVLAKTLHPISLDMVGTEVALQRVSGGWLILGCVQPPGPAPLSLPAPDVSAVLDIDGNSTVLRAKKRITLKCGKASITLTRAGKILLNGTYVLSHSDGLQRVEGAVVEIN